MTLQNKTDFVDKEVVASIQNARLEGMRDLLQNGLQGAHAVSQHCPGGTERFGETERREMSTTTQLNQAVTTILLLNYNIVCVMLLWVHSPTVLSP